MFAFFSLFSIFLELMVGPVLWVYVHLSPYTRDNSEAAISAASQQPHLLSHVRENMAYSMAIFSTLPVLMASETNEDGILINPLKKILHNVGAFELHLQHYILYTYIYVYGKFLAWNF